MGRLRWTLAAPLAAAALLAARPAAAQMPEHFENLQVLPKDIPRDSLLQIMRGFATSLGVRCNYCHVTHEATTPGGRETFDFKSDDKIPKQKARFMIRMVQNLNGQILPQVPHRHDPPVSVGCVTCHRGLPIPTTLDRVLAAAVDSGGAQAAIARYRQLRDQQGLTGRYDFSEGTVNELARRLAASGKAADATALLEMNAEFYPNSAQIDAQLGELYARSGDRDKAIVHYRMAAQKDPNNPMYRRRLDELTGAAPAPAPNPQHR
jgi:tetratricopeptide (TPR) repeat protein